MKRKFISLLVILLFMFSVQAISMQTEAKVNVGDHCDNPTTTLSITAAPSGQDSDVSFNKDSFTAPTGKCFMMKFTNKAPSQEHNFVFDKTSGFGGVDISLMNNISEPNNNGTQTSNLMAPLSATELTFYCNIPGHKAAGMKGIITFGSGSNSNSSGFTFGTAIIGLLSTLAAIPVFRRKYRK